MSYGANGSCAPKSLAALWGGVESFSYAAHLLESKRRGYKSLSSNMAVTSPGLWRRGGMVYMMKGYNQERQHFKEDSLGRQGERVALGVRAAVCMG